MSIQEIQNNLEEFLFEELTEYMENRFKLDKLIVPDIKHLLKISLNYNDFDRRIKIFRNDYIQHAEKSENMQFQMSSKILTLKDAIELANPDINFSELFSKARKRIKEDDSVKLQLISNYSVRSKSPHKISVNAKFPQPLTLHFLKDCFDGDQTYLSGIKAIEVNFDLLNDEPFIFILEDGSEIEIFKCKENTYLAYFLLKEQQIDCNIIEENSVWR